MNVNDQYGSMTLGSPVLNCCGIVCVLHFDKVVNYVNLEGNADIPPVLEGYFMNFRVGIHQDGNLQNNNTQTHTE